MNEPAGTETTSAEIVALRPESIVSEGGEDALIIALDGYGGPLDVLLTLARQQKVDLTRLSMLDLAEQYLAFIDRARTLKLELAADYLVMAAWLAYLKSRLLLPDPPADEGPSGEEMVALLAFRLRKLEAMRDAAQKLMARARLGVDVFGRGAGEGVEVVKTPVFEAALYDLLKSYAEYRARVTQADSFRIEASEHYSMEDAYLWLTKIIGAAPEWETLIRFLPSGGISPVQRRSAVASALVASLELAKQGKIQIKQLEPFGPIYLRSASNLP
ncbi:MAG: segregation/condensation protein A [Alphaproteobacteria bacterium]|nr:segregation/condensation protein A [Alphaproteobacteria bacterium]